MISDVVLSLAFAGLLRGRVDKNEDFDTVVVIRTQEDVARLLDCDDLSSITDALDTNGDGQISPWELAWLELKGAEYLSFELSSDDAFALADGSVREDGEPATAYVPAEHVREWLVAAVWASYLRIGDMNGDQVLDDAEWDLVFATMSEELAQLAESSPSGGWSLSVSELLSAQAADTGAAALAAAWEVMGRLPIERVQRRRFFYIGFVALNYCYLWHWRYNRACGWN